MRACSRSAWATPPQHRRRTGSTCLPCPAFGTATSRLSGRSCAPCGTRVSKFALWRAIRQETTATNGTPGFPSLWTGMRRSAGLCASSMRPRTRKRPWTQPQLCATSSVPSPTLSRRQRRESWAHSGYLCMQRDAWEFMDGLPDRGLGVAGACAGEMCSFANHADS